MILASNKLSWEASYSDKDKRLLSFLSEKNTFSNISKKKIKRLIDKGACTVNGSIERFSTHKIRENDRIEIASSWNDILNEKENKNIEILYEDEYFIAIDKPEGIVCKDENFISFFDNHYFLVHRLDSATSGVLLFAKKKSYKMMMKKLFLLKKVKKIYFAIVDDIVLKNRGKIESYLSKKSYFDGQTLWKSTNSDKGLYSLSYFEKVNSKNNTTLLRCEIITGRTHQLRVHLLEMGHPILGDYLYCKNFTYKKYVKRLLLHSHMMSFIHPITKAKVNIKSPIPSTFENY